MRKFYSEKEIEFIKANYLNMTDAELADKLDRDIISIKNFKTRHNLKLPSHIAQRRRARGEFKKGEKPWNKGIRGRRVSPATEFKPGIVPPNTKWDGAITIRRKRGNGEAYKYIRISKGKWKLYHHYVWEQAHGTIPENSIIRFRNGDSLDCRLENLEMITRAENAHRNMNRKKQSETLRKSDKFVASRMSIKQPKLRRWLLQHGKHLIEIKKEQYELNRKLREIS